MNEKVSSVKCSVPFFRLLHLSLFPFFFFYFSLAMQRTWWTNAQSGILWRCYNLCSFYAQPVVNFDKMIWLLKFIFPLVMIAFSRMLIAWASSLSTIYTYTFTHFAVWYNKFGSLFFLIYKLDCNLLASISQSKHI